jgi:CRISPR/Cas system-associated exonuclease Cas4 (RecB family)
MFSLIPQEVRKQFAMTTIQKQEILQKHQFDRLVFHAENIVFCFCEPSAYLLQMEYEGNFEIEKITQKTEVFFNSEEVISVEKTPEMLNKLREKYKEKPLSPSAFNVYIDCPLAFYFRYVAEIRIPDEKKLDSAALGKIFHKTMELIYKKNCENPIEKAFEEEGYGDNLKTGEGMIIFKVISRMLKNMLEYDKNREEKFEVIGLEEEHCFEIDGIKIGGIIDRIDKIGEKIRVVDYKTGGRKKIENYEFQTYLYSRALSQKFAADKISSELIFVLESKINGEKIEYLSIKKEEFDEKFNEKFAELFSIEIPFSQCENYDFCKYCDYSEICAR